MALLLGIVGIYGVIAYVVSQRTREIGIRIGAGRAAGGIIEDVRASGICCWLASEPPWGWWPLPD